MILVEDEPACSTRQIENVMLCSFAATDQAQCADHDGCCYCAQTHVTRVPQNQSSGFTGKCLFFRYSGTGAVCSNSISSLAAANDSYASRLFFARHM